MKTKTDTKNFAKKLLPWVKNASGDEDRNNAALEIMKAYEQESKTLNLSAYKLQTLPDELGELSWLETLNLSDNNIKNLSGWSGFAIPTLLSINRFTIYKGRDCKSRPAFV